MPNGGPDCCGNCSHNKSVQEMAHPHPEKFEEFWELSFCTLREINITNPFWTYCENFTYGKHPEERNENENPSGLISSSGLYEGYVRIPWDGANEPNVSVPAECIICDIKTNEGITIEHNRENIEFCTNRHYIQWWKTIHDDDSINPEDYETPDERYSIGES